jgi:hypothetical protein
MLLLQLPVLLSTMNQAATMREVPTKYSCAAPAVEILNSRHITVCAVELDSLGHLMPGDAMGYLALTICFLSTLAAAFRPAAELSLPFSLSLSSPTSR